MTDWLITQILAEHLIWIQRYFMCSKKKFFFSKWVCQTRRLEESVMFTLAETVGHLGFYQKRPSYSALVFGLWINTTPTDKSKHLGDSGGGSSRRNCIEEIGNIRVTNCPPCLPNRCREAIKTVKDRWGVVGVARYPAPGRQIGRQTNDKSMGQEPLDDPWRHGYVSLSPVGKYRCVWQFNGQITRSVFLSGLKCVGY